MNRKILFLFILLFTINLFSSNDSVVTSNQYTNDVPLEHKNNIISNKMANLPNIEGYIESIKVDISRLTLVLGVITLILSIVLVFREYSSYRMDNIQKKYIKELQNKVMKDLDSISSSIDFQVAIALSKKNNALIKNFNKIARSKLDNLETRIANSMFYMQELSLEIVMIPNSNVDESKIHKILLQLMRSSYDESEIIETITELSYLKTLFKDINYKQDKFKIYYKSLPHVSISKRQERITDEIQNIIHEIEERKIA